MYYYIKGKLVYKDDSSLAIDAGGVAYSMNTTTASLIKAGDIGGMVTMYTYLHIREDIMELYGFADTEEKRMFMLLISVSGVGPKAALSILSVLSPKSFAAAVVTDDVKSITKAAGVGPKLAQRIALELRDKLKNEDLIGMTDNEESISVSNSKNEAISALVALGYSVNDAKTAVGKVDSSLGVEEIIKKALLSL